MTALSHFYVVRGVARHGTVTYNCPTPEWAVRKYRDLTAQELSEVTITDPDGESLTLTQLENASDVTTVPSARVSAHQA